MTSSSPSEKKDNYVYYVLWFVILHSVFIQCLLTYLYLVLQFLKDIFLVAMECFFLGYFTGVSSPGVPGMPGNPQILAYQLSLPQPGDGGRLCPINNTGTPGFSDLQAAV